MHNLLNYVPPVVAFVAMFVGLLGPSRRPDSTGLEAITGFGWMSCAIAATSLLIAIYLQYKKERDLQAARASQQQMRVVVTEELAQGVRSLEDVIRYAALMPYISTATTSIEISKDVPYIAYAKSRQAWDIDLRSEEVVGVLEVLYLSPIVTLQGPFVPSAVPFGTSISRNCMTVIVDESKAAVGRIETAIQKYASVALTHEIIQTGSKVTTSPFLIHLTRLRESWDNRSRMEDSNQPRTLNFKFLNSGLTGGYKQDYFEFIDRLDSLSTAMKAAKLAAHST